MSETTPKPEDTAQARAAAAAAAAPKPRRSAIWWALNMVVFFVVLAVLISWAARSWWVFDLASHFRVQYAALLSLAAVILFIGRWFKWGLVVAVLAGTQIWALAPFYWDKPDVPRELANQQLEAAAAVLEEDDSPSVTDLQGLGGLGGFGMMPPTVVAGPVPGRDANWVRVMSANVRTSNIEYRRLIELVNRERPDILFIMECDDAWIQALGELPGEYSNSALSPRRDNFGVALFSRYPLYAEVQSLGGEDIPVIVATCDTPAGKLDIIGAHTLPPMRPDTAEFRNEQLEYLARIVEYQQSPQGQNSLDGDPIAPSGKAPNPLVVIGDWNITSWSPHFRDLIEATGLRDTRRGLGLQTTWPAALPAPLRIPIDHAIVSPEIDVLDRRIGEAIGSDHLPVILDILIPNSAPATGPLAPDGEMIEWGGDLEQYNESDELDSPDTLLD